MTGAMPRGSQVSQTQAQCLLFRLPKECRDLIYSLVLTSQEPIRWPAETLHRSLTPALLRTCRQIHAEATPVLYEANFLSFNHPSDCSMFANITDPTHGRRLKSVTLRVRAGSADRLWKSYLTSTAPIRSLAADLPNLRGLVLTLEGNAWSRHRPPEDNLAEWFHRETGFVVLAQAAETIAAEADHDRPVRVRISCQQRVPQGHFDQLYSSRAVLEPGHHMGRAALVAASETCLRMGSGNGSIPWTLNIVCKDVPAGE